MSASTDAVCALGLQIDGATIDDNLTALAGGAQNTSPRLKSTISRFTKVATAADSCQLPNIVSGENGGRVRLVVNDTANAVAVFPSAGENINALAANTALSVPANQSAIFVPTAPVRAGGAPTLVGNWRAAVIP